MYKRFSKELLIKSFIILIAIGLFSCGSTKNLKYFQDIPDTTKMSYIKLQDYKTPLIHPGDILGVNVYTVDINATQSVNAISSAPAAVTGAGGTNIDYQPSGYIVDKEGNIEIQELGKIKVENLTIEQIQAVIKVKASQYFNDPIVIVKNNDFKITFIGEFLKTGTFIIQREKFTLIDAIGLSGLSDFARRDDIVLLRQNKDSAISTIRINLLNTNILKSPYYYLQNNDILLANPNRSKGIATDQTFSRTLTLYSLSASLLTTLLVLFKL